MRVAVVGAGYVGLTTAACLAKLGHSVAAADRDPARVAALRAGVCPVREPGLDDLLREGLSGGHLSFWEDSGDVAAGAEVTFLCVPTPAARDGSPDVSAVESAAADVRDRLPAGAVLAVKSTARVGTGRRVADIVRRADVSVVVTPEFLREGTAVEDFLRPDRVVVGAEEEDAAVRVAGLFVRLGAPVLVVSRESAELIKYATNAFVSSKISFANAVAELCEALGADAREVLPAVGADRRVGPDFLRPGPGWGGSCLPKDSLALLRLAEEYGVPVEPLRVAVEVNERQAGRVAARVMRYLEGWPRTAWKVGMWGLAFKAGTGDLRESPALRVAARLTEAGVLAVRAYDPAVRDPVPGVVNCSLIGPYEAARDCPVLLVATEWDEFRHADLDKLGRSMSRRVIVDARGVVDPEAARAAGFTLDVVGVGVLPA